MISPAAAAFHLVMVKEVFAGTPAAPDAHYVVLQAWNDDQNAVDGHEVRPVRLEPTTPSDLLSDQLEVFGRDRIYEEAVRNYSSQPT